MMWVALVFSVMALVAWGITVMDFAKLEERVERHEDVLRALLETLPESETQKLLTTLGRNK
jgi:hypothetical protein